MDNPQVGILRRGSQISMFLYAVKIAPSILSADFGKLREEVEFLNASGADVIHVDVMDGRFVPNISFGFPVLEALRKYSTKPLDVHIMIVEPEKFALDFIKAGADWLSFHLEASVHAHRLLEQIKRAGAKAGLALNPQTTTGSVPFLSDHLDFVNLMSVNPGFGGQSFIPSSLQKVRDLADIRSQMQLNFEIEIDGGVNMQNALSLVEAGANVLVAGNAVFKAENPTQAIEAFKALCG